MNGKQIFIGLLVMAATVSSRASVVTFGGITFDISEVASGVGTNPNGPGGYDIWDINVTNLSGADAAPGLNGVGISSIDGTFSVRGTGSTTNAFLTPGANAAAVKNGFLEGSDDLSAANPGGGANYTGVSYLNMDTYSSFSRTGQTPASGSQHSTYSYTVAANVGILNGVYIGPSSDAGGPSGFNGPDNPLLAEVIVTHGSLWNLSGSVTTAGGKVENVFPVTPEFQLVFISIASSPANSVLGTEMVTGGNGNYQIASDVSGLNASDGSIAVSDIGSESGTFIVGLKVTGDVGAVLYDLGESNPGWTFINVNGGSIDGLPGTGWNIEASTANPRTAGGNDYVNWSNFGFAGAAVTEIAAIPEPSTLGLIGLGTVLAAHRRRRSA